MQNEIGDKRLFIFSNIDIISLNFAANGAGQYQIPA
jgi:hypothetical protein